MGFRGQFVSTHKVFFASTILVVAVIALGAGAASESPGGAPVLGVTTIATGADASVDGFLAVSPDDYGQWASLGFAGGGDIFNPAGAFGPLEATFSSAFWLSVPSRGQRAVLTENADHIGVASDGSLLLLVTSPSVSSDSSGNGTDDTLTSSFNVTGIETNLDFDLTQTIEDEGNGVANLQQEYVITNLTGLAIDFNLARVYDGDFLWAGDPGNEFANDQVGTGTNADGGDLYVFEQEPLPSAGDGGNETTVTISSPDATSYFGGKNGVQPAGGPPPYAFGTDTQVFDAFGVPATWENHIAGVGYDTDGVSGPTPAGSTPPEDGFAGLGIPVSLGAGESTTVTIRFTYGQEGPSPDEPPVPIVEIPTLDTLGLAVLVAMLAILGGVLLRRRSIA